MEYKPFGLHKCGEVMRQVTAPIALYKHSFPTNKGKFFPFGQFPENWNSKI